MASWETVLIALPDRKLTLGTFDAVGKEIAAVGHLWMRKVVPFVNGGPPEPAKLQRFAMSENGKEVTVELYYLGVTRTVIGSLELSIFAKDRQPLVKVPLVKMDAAAEGATRRACSSSPYSDATRPR